jgi:hypothetical protein
MNSLWSFILGLVLGAGLVLSICFFVFRRLLLIR